MHAASGNLSKRMVPGAFVTPASSGGVQMHLASDEIRKRDVHLKSEEIPSVSWSTIFENLKIPFHFGPI